MNKSSVGFVPFRVGIGFDVHKFAQNRPLILGGVKVSQEGGLDGHSDADVVLHAICDALFGAAGLPDIGQHFPNTDERYRNVHSTELLSEARKELGEHGWAVGNVDATIICERPKLAPFVPQMVEIIAEILNVAKAQVNIKATTSETLGYVGRGEGIASIATALIVSSPNTEARDYEETPA